MRPRRLLRGRCKTKLNDHSKTQHIRGIQRRGEIIRGRTYFRKCVLSAGTRVQLVAHPCLGFVPRTQMGGIGEEQNGCVSPKAKIYLRVKGAGKTHILSVRTHTSKRNTFCQAYAGRRPRGPLRRPPGGPCAVRGALDPYIQPCATQLAPDISKTSEASRTMIMSTSNSKAPRTLAAHNSSTIISIQRLENNANVGCEHSKNRHNSCPPWVVFFNPP